MFSSPVFNLQVVELRDICKANELKGYSKLKKDDLIDLILNEVKTLA